jgi:hypothetical protein
VVVEGLAGRRGEFAVEVGHQGFDDFAAGHGRGALGAVWGR